MPFWSSSSRARKIIKMVPAYAGFERHEISWDDFRDEWLPGMERDGLLVGGNWTVPKAKGYDLPPGFVRDAVEARIDELRK
jgi:hypothetical protein